MIPARATMKRWRIRRKRSLNVSSWDQCYKTFISSSLTVELNKLECLSQASKILAVKPGACPGGQCLKSAPSRQALDLLANIRQYRKNLLRANTLAYSSAPIRIEENKIDSFDKIFCR